jgi:signal transduction histidine kinase
LPKLKAVLESIFPGHSALAERMRGLDWPQTPLGPPEAWPPALRVATGICLGSGFAVQLMGGPQLTLLFNEAALALFGPRHAQMLGRPAAEAWGEAWPQVAPLIDRALGGAAGAAGPHDLKLRLERSVPREEVHLRLAFAPIAGDDGGAPLGLLCTLIDTTAAQLEQRRMAMLLELAARCSAVATPGEVCEAAAEGLAADPQDVAFAAIYLRENGGDNALLCAASGSLPPGLTAPRQLSLPEPALHWPHALLLPIPLPDTELPAGLLLASPNLQRPLDAGLRGCLEQAARQIGRAMSDKREYAREQQRSDALSRLDQDKTVFFNNVSHEFRTALSLMLAPLDDVLGNLDDPDSPTAAALRMVQRNAMRLLRLVGALLDQARMESGRMQASFEPTDLSALTTDIASVFRAVMERGGLAYNVRCEPLGEPIYVDRDMWEKIVLNLLSNAFKYTLQGNIDVLLLRAGEHAVLAVRDSGIGVAPEELPNLFQRFHRVEGARARTHEGSGIGLSLAKELVQAHGGVISVRSEVGVGSVFKVSLPFGKDHLPPERVHEARTMLSPSSSASSLVEEALRWLPTPSSRARGGEPDPTTPGALGEVPGKRVLVADDNADMRDYLSRLLGQRWQVETAADGEEALALLREQRFDLLLSDVMMPRLDGLALLQTLRRDPALATLPVIMLSAKAGEESRVEGMQSGADDYLVKPFSAREVVARVEAQLRMSALRRWVNESLRAEVAERRAAEEQVRELLRRLVNAQEDERRRISRELHDTLGQHLSAVTLGLKTLRARAECPPVVAEGLDRVYEAAAQLDDAMDRLAYELRPAVLDDLGLADALRSHVQGWTLQTGVPVELHTRGLGGRLPADVEVTVYRVVQEALTNIHKHAQATRVGVISERRGADVRVIVEDDGCGFDATDPDPLGDGRRRLGLRGMSERAGLVGGKLQLESEPGRGTTVYLTVPISDS